jgi:5-methyltetrahydropteroyltriglutamate--homocysteine methyltransferase
MHFYAGRQLADPQIYGDAEEFFADLSLIFRQEIADLAKAGCRYTQLDEVAIAMLCDPLVCERAKAEGGHVDAVPFLYENGPFYRRRFDRLGLAKGHPRHR